MCYSTTQLMNLKFNLSKYAKITGFENYPMAEASKLWDLYLQYLEKNENKDIDFPDLNLKFE
jgi:hypothetical protein